jgi:inorganic phosphate transporter, PiT family
VDGHQVKRAGTSLVSSPPDVLLLAAAITFAVVNGANDGGALLAVGLGVRSLRPLTALLVLTTTLVVAPLVIGTQVAATLADRLVGFEGRAGEVALLVAVGATVAVVWALSWRGLPTSLTLALVGAIAGVGAGSQLPVSWGAVAIVLALAALAPVLATAAAWALSRVAARLPARRPLRRRVPPWHGLAFVLLALAYGANDGQKMLAVLALAAGTTTNLASPAAWQLAAIGTAFTVGAVLGLPRIARSLSGGVVPTRPPEIVLTELSSAGVVLGTAAVGAPVSMTQTISAALIGNSVTRGAGRVRWRHASRIGLAWLVTLPAAFLLALGSAVLAIP